jgi:DNA-binding CsgD family transcriptional regulator
VFGVGALGPLAEPPGAAPAAESGPVARLHALGLDAALLASEACRWLLERGLALAAQASGHAGATRLDAPRTGAAGLSKGQPLLAIREPQAPADAMQALLLLRGADAPAFGTRERRLVERLAPHAMRALTTARALAEARQRAASPRPQAPTTVARAAPTDPVAPGTPTTPTTLGTPPIPATGSTGPAADPLNDTERAVARLYAAGHTDREITERLALPPGAVREHLRRVFAVLGVASRAQVGVLLG